MKQNGVVSAGPALLFFILQFRARKVNGTFEKRAPGHVVDCQALRVEVAWLLALGSLSRRVLVAKLTF